MDVGQKPNMGKKESSMKVKGVKKSKYVERIPKGANVTRVEGGLGDPRLAEVTVMVMTDSLANQLKKSLQDARALGIQRMETDCRIESYRCEIFKKIPLALESFDVHVAAYKDAEGHERFLLVDGGHKSTAAIEAYEEGHRDFLIVVHVWEAGNLEAVRMFASQFDSRDAVRTASDLINTTFGREQAKLLKTHIRLLNAAIVNILKGCDEDLRKVRECDPRFPRMKILSPSNLMYVKNNHMDLLLWFNKNFTIRGAKDPMGKLMNVGVVTAIILSRLVYGEEVCGVWKHYVDGTFVPDAGQKALRNLWAHCIQNKENGGGERVQLDMFQRATHAFLTAWNYTSTHKEDEYQEGARYQISRGMVSEAPKASASASKKAGKLMVTATATATVVVGEKTSKAKKKAA